VEQNCVVSELVELVLTSLCKCFLVRYWLGEEEEEEEILGMCDRFIAECHVV